MQTIIFKSYFFFIFSLRLFLCLNATNHNRYFLEKRKRKSANKKKQRERETGHKMLLKNEGVEKHGLAAIALAKTILLKPDMASQHGQ